MLSKIRLSAFTNSSEKLTTNPVLGGKKMSSKPTMSAC